MAFSHRHALSFATRSQADIDHLNQMATDSPQKAFMISKLHLELNTSRLTRPVTSCGGILAAVCLGLSFNTPGLQGPAWLAALEIISGVGAMGSGLFSMVLFKTAQTMGEIWLKRLKDPLNKVQLEPSILKAFEQARDYCQSLKEKGEIERHLKHLNRLKRVEQFFKRPFTLLSLTEKETSPPESKPEIIDSESKDSKRQLRL